MHVAASATSSLAAAPGRDHGIRFASLDDGRLAESAADRVILGRRDQPCQHGLAQRLMPEGRHDGRIRAPGLIRVRRRVDATVAPDPVEQRFADLHRPCRLAAGRPGQVAQEFDGIAVPCLLREAVVAAVARRARRCDPGEHCLQCGDVLREIACLGEQLAHRSIAQPRRGRGKLARVDVQLPEHAKPLDSFVYMFEKSHDVSMATGSDIAQGITRALWITPRRDRRTTQRPADLRTSSARCSAV